MCTPAEGGDCSATRWKTGTRKAMACVVCAKATDLFWEVWWRNPGGQFFTVITLLALAIGITMVSVGETGCDKGCEDKICQSTSGASFDCTCGFYCRDKTYQTGTVGDVGMFLLSVSSFILIWQLCRTCCCGSSPQAPPQQVVVMMPATTAVVQPVAAVPIQFQHPQQEQV